MRRCLGAWLLASLVTGLRLDRNSSNHSAAQEPLTFQAYLESVTSGRGIWKWSNALDAYERHFAVWKNHPVRLGEVGVWSGGSLLMWHAVMGPQCTVYGMDISKDALNFQEPPKTNIVLMDQGKVEDWQRFFAAVPNLEILVDDGGHTSPLMVTTNNEAWPHISPGGSLAIEDVHGAHYLEDFWIEVAKFYGQLGRADLASLHVYPFLLIAEKAASWKAAVDPSLFPGAVVAPSGRISDWAHVQTAIDAAPPGTVVVLEDPATGDFLAEGVIAHVFRYFIGLHAPLEFKDSPAGCALTNTPVCASIATNSPQMSRISGLHLLPNKLVVEIAAKPPVIQAVRHGTEWVKYPTHS